MTFQEVDTEEPVLTYEGELNSIIVPQKGEFIEFNNTWYSVDHTTRHYSEKEMITHNYKGDLIKIRTTVIVVCIWIKELE